MQLDVRALIFEIARSEIGYTGIRPAEYAASIRAAAIKEGYQGPLFLQGDQPCETSYRDKAGKYQGQRGVTLPKI